MVGAGRVEITPEIGCYLGGYYAATQRSIDVHDPLYARALVLDNGSTRLAIVSLELIIANGVMVNELKEMIRREFDIPAENISVTATHTHTGPEGYYEEFGKYPKEYVPEMKQAIQRNTLEAVRQAVENPAPASVGFVQFDLEGFSSNRHNPAGPLDHTAILFVVKDAAGKPVAGFLNFAAHPTVVPAGDLLISGDWPGEFQRLMEEKMGGGAVFLFLQGAAGNVGPVTSNSIEVNFRTFSQ
ncbi:MAG: neutral/alkaline non-lysosomal ceramidase N-terminal domain-containing protein [bacterium]